MLIENLSFLPLTAELPPGSGKSTLGRLVLRLLPTAGKVVFYDGTDLGALALPRCAVPPPLADDFQTPSRDRSGTAENAA